jgi:hypothetical protein
MLFWLSETGMPESVVRVGRLAMIKSPVFYSCFGDVRPVVVLIACCARRFGDIAAIRQSLRACVGTRLWFR